MFAASSADGTRWSVERLGHAPRAPTGFGQTAGGELWMGSYGIGDAVLYRLVIADAIFGDAFDE